jgi:hypothetical protein
VTAYLFAGTNLNNASINLTANNASLSKDTVYSVDVSNSAILILVPTTNNNYTDFQFSYYVDGDEYNWW